SFSSDLGGMRIQGQAATGSIDASFLAAAVGNSATEKMRISGKGNVGIGTISPTAKRDVKGTVKAADASLCQPSMGYYEVRCFGAKADGVADDTASIQAAIDAAQAAGRGVVQFPPGTYTYCISRRNLRGGMHLRVR